MMSAKLLPFMAAGFALLVLTYMDHGFNGVIRVAAMLLSIPAVYFLYLGIEVLFFVDKELYERNRRATLLARTYNHGRELSEVEQLEIEHFIRQGILKHQGLVYTIKKPRKFLSPLRLTDRALDQVWH